MEAIEQTWNGTTNANGKCSATISRNGDLIHRMYLDVATAAANNNLSANYNPGSNFIKTVELEIGGQSIDKHPGYWMETWAQLTQPNNFACAGYAVADSADIGTNFQRMAGMGSMHVAAALANVRYHVPLQFWFCRNVGLALPLIALQYHEVKVILDHRVGTIFHDTGTAGEEPSLKLWVDYIYLDTDERRRFAQVSHEYLIEQLQENILSDAAAGSTNELTFNHPVKELIWIVKPDLAAPATSGLVDTHGGVTKNLKDNGYQLKLNGHDRLAKRSAIYFTRVQVYQNHSGPGGLDSNLAVGVRNHRVHNDSIGVYSFALKPEEHQPSGTCNFSRIDNAQFTCGVNNDADTIFAVNYNVLRIMSGMGGLAYSN